MVKALGKLPFTKPLTEWAKDCALSRDDERRLASLGNGTHRGDMCISRLPAFLRMAASGSYENNWKDIGYDARGDLPGMRAGSWELVDQAQKHAVWVNHRIKSVLISLEGTAKASDWLHNLGSIGGNMRGWDPLYRGDLRLFDALRKKYKGYEIRVVGHSLGGDRARYVGTNKRVPSYGFNEGSSGSSGASLSRWLLSGKSQHTVYRVEGDKVSLPHDRLNKTSASETIPCPGCLTSPSSWAGYAHTDGMKDAWPLPPELQVCNKRKRNALYPADCL